jgi:hypothetical protein
MLFSVEGIVKSVFTYRECGRSYCATVRRLQEKFPGEGGVYNIQCQRFNNYLQIPNLT